jgi:hypothetical protein
VEVVEGGVGVLPVFSGGFEVAADVGEDLDACFGSPAAADFLVDFGHAEISFGLVVVEGDVEVLCEGQDLGLVVEHGARQVRGCTFWFGGRFTVD